MSNRYEELKLISSLQAYVHVLNEAEQLNET